MQYHFYLLKNKNPVIFEGDRGAARTIFLKHSVMKVHYEFHFIPFSKKEAQFRVNYKITLMELSDIGPVRE